MPIVSSDGKSFATIPDDDPDLPEIKKAGAKVYHDVEMNGQSARIPEEDLSQVLSAGATLRRKIQPKINEATQRELTAGTLVKDPVTGMIKPAKPASETPDYNQAIAATLADAGKHDTIKELGESGRVGVESLVPGGRHITSAIEAALPQEGTTYGQRYEDILKRQSEKAEEYAPAALAGNIAGSIGAGGLAGKALGVAERGVALPETAGVLQKAGRFVTEGLKDVAAGGGQALVGQGASAALAESQRPLEEMSAQRIGEAATDPAGLALGAGTSALARLPQLGSALKEAAQKRAVSNIIKPSPAMAEKMAAVNPEAGKTALEEGLVGITGLDKDALKEARKAASSKLKSIYTTVDEANPEGLIKKSDLVERLQSRLADVPDNEVGDVIRDTIESRIQKLQSSKNPNMSARALQQDKSFHQEAAYGRGAAPTSSAERDARKILADEYKKELDERVGAIAGKEYADANKHASDLESIYQATRKQTRKPLVSKEDVPWLSVGGAKYAALKVLSRLAPGAQVKAANWLGSALEASSSGAVAEVLKTAPELAGMPAITRQAFANELVQNKEDPEKLKGTIEKYIGSK